MRLRPRPLALAAALAVAVVGGGAAPAGAEPGDAQLKATTVSRISGADRIATAVQAARSFSGQKADAVVLARADSFADSLAAAPLASDAGGPLLLTPSGGLDATVADTVRDVLAPGGTVYLLGGTSALSGAVEQSVRSLGVAGTVRRVAGTDRFGTAVEVAKLLPEATSVSVVTGWNFPDGLAAGALMGVVDSETEHSVGLVLLSDGNELGATTAGYLGTRNFATKIAIGGPAAVAVSGQAGWAPIAGADRYDTSARLARQFTSNGFFEDATTIVGIATGEGWADALSGSALLAYGGGPLLLTQPGQLPGVTATALRDLQADARATQDDQGNPLEVGTALVFGGTNAVQDAVLTEIRDALA
ncbi:cell wall-binding repeat-containing protein [Paenibacillus sp. TRM 82003]|uniref:cell wall-binding repeat-containing protein n=1 Tax=Kineococcus sp. TRM81007 TaxID=2925831 RepID=UPI001F57CCD3|nr:cell wall-binding repeat-containing protein [Kineococcus sp. TRM81007]MCI2238217.1 cell wall-binding repeat-containing protein [Kineococcus sp. TRM81007]MCI3924558.1 cell wall-binding repeat-containing protein [Paenibacillus sp. TRM 82003]